jgi:hypothetical protein
MNRKPTGKAMRRAQLDYKTIIIIIMALLLALVVFMVAKKIFAGYA